MKKRLIVLLMLVIGSLISCKFIPKPEIERIEEYWKTQFPKGVIEYTASDRGGFQGDGTTYMVIKLDSEPSEFIADFVIGKNVAYESAVNMCLNGIENASIPKEYLPNWEQPYLYKFIGEREFTEIENQENPYFHYGKSLFLTYYPELQILLICEILF